LLPIFRVPDLTPVELSYLFSERFCKRLLHMTPIAALLQFLNIVAIARICAPAGEEYDMRGKLVADCRERKYPFLLEMPLRHHFRCAICGAVRGQVAMHFEDPRQPLSDTSGDSTSISFLGNPVGRFAQVQMSVLHRVLAHGDSIPSQLDELFANVGS
jgi:hypothetical protein